MTNKRATARARQQQGQKQIPTGRQTKEQQQEQDNSKGKRAGWGGVYIPTLATIKPSRRWGTQTFLAGFRKDNCKRSKEAFPDWKIENASLLSFAIAALFKLCQ